MPPYFPPRSEAAEVADDLAAFADRYPLMWSTTRRKLLAAVESLRYQVKHGYVGSSDTTKLEAGQ
jgi:hypothetical protein